MAKYVLKSQTLSVNRITRIAKEFITESKEDRERALSAYDYFKGIADNSLSEGEAINGSTAQKCMVDCLKLAQESRNKTLKAFELMLKLTKDIKTSSEDKKGDEFSFSDINS